MGILSIIKKMTRLHFIWLENINGTWQRTGVGLEFDPGAEISSKTYTCSPDEITVSSLYNVKTRQKVPYGFQNR